MQREDKLYPELLTAQAEQVYKKLTNDNYNLKLVAEHITNFINESALIGAAYDSARSQFEDYKLIFEEIKNTNIEMMAECRSLVQLIGTEIYDGKEIFDQQLEAEEAKLLALDEAELWWSEAQDEELDIVRWYYELRAKACEREAEKCQAIWDELEAKKKEFDKIEQKTKDLFDASSERNAQRSYLRSIILAYSGGKYNINDSQKWRVGLREKYKKLTAEWDPEVVEELKKLGMTDAEIKELRLKGVVLIQDDIKLIKNSLGGKGATFSCDSKAVIYNGKVYYVNVPSERTYHYDGGWKTVEVKYGNQVDIDPLAAITGLEMDGPGIDDEDGNIVDYNEKGKFYLSQKNSETLENRWKQVGWITIASNIPYIIDDATSVTYTKMEFEEKDGVGRVTILLGTESMTERLENAQYYGEINSYKNQEGVIGKHWASDEAKFVYTYITGEDTDEDKTYTLISTLDERHKEDTYQGYLYYEDGNIMCKPIVYPEDKAYVATCNFHTGNHPQKILDCTEYLETPTRVNYLNDLMVKTMKDD